jgi:hypothetical protein
MQSMTKARKVIGRIHPEAFRHLEELKTIAVNDLGDKLPEAVMKNPNWWVTLGTCKHMIQKGWMTA